MSEILSMTFNMERAVAFNARHGVRYWGDLQLLDDSLLLDRPCLTCPPDSEDFAVGVRQLQVELFDDDTEHDGKLGAGTWAALLEFAEGVRREAVKETIVAAYPKRAVLDAPTNWIIRGGGRVPVDSDTKILTWKDEDGLDLHQDGGWSRRSNKPDLVIVHWGGRNARSCRNALASRNLSSHFGTDRNIIYQWLDTTHKAWHAGRPNGRSIGIDICQQPTTNLAAWYDKRGYDLETIPNPSSRGNRKVLTLHPETVTATADLLRAVTAMYSIPLAFPETDKVLSRSELADFRGVVGHHHVSAKKWDVAPWFPAIRAALGV